MRLRDQFSSQIRGVENDFRVSKAKILYQITNAQLAVVIKDNLNAAEDIADLTADIEALQALNDPNSEIQGKQQQIGQIEAL